MINPVKIIEERQRRKLEDRVLDVLISRAPNGLQLSSFRRILTDLTDQKILTALETLSQNGRVIPKTHTNQFIPGRVNIFYSLPSPTQYPMHDTIRIGDVEFPRFFHGDMADAEDINIFAEAMAEYDSKIVRRIGDLAATLTRRYWTNIATLFGLFVALFALILRASEPIALQASITPKDLFFLKVAELLPLAIILFLFVVALHFLLRKF